MENVMNVAAWACRRYRKDFGQDIDEMKLHKLLYFAQRESLVRSSDPMFGATFYGWKYGPVLPEVREEWGTGALKDMPVTPLSPENEEIMDYIFGQYAAKSSWSLSRLSHGELSWQNSREGIAEDENSNNPMRLEDIRKDADRIRTHRAKLDIMRALGLLPEE